MPPVRGRGSPLCSEFGSTETGKKQGVPRRVHEDDESTDEAKKLV